MSEFRHVSLRSRGREQSSAFYTQNFGFQETRRGGTGIGTLVAMLATPTTNTYIEVSDRVKMGHDFEIAEELLMLQLSVRDLPAAYERLQRNGVKIDGSAGDDYFFLADADGYEIEVTRGDEDNAWTSFGLRVSDLDRSARFYQEFLGFRERRRWTTPRGTQIAVMELPGNKTTIALRYMPFLKSKVEVPEDLMHLAFPIADLSTFRQKMVSAGYRVYDEDPRFCYDPDGYELEMVRP